MDVHFTPEQESQLAQIANMAGTDPERLVKDAALRLLQEDARFRAAVGEGIAQADRAEFIEEEEMDARLEQMLQSLMRIRPGDNGVGERAQLPTLAGIRSSNRKCVSEQKTPLWGSLVSCGRLVIGPTQRVPRAFARESGGRQPPRRLPAGCQPAPHHASNATFMSRTRPRPVRSREKMRPQAGVGKLKHA